MKMRLQRFLASAGIASRRAAEVLIEEGSVRVNGKRATLGMSVDSEVDRVSVEGRPVREIAEKVYLMLHKPREVMSTKDDDKGRRTVMDLLPREFQHASPVGRLDYHSSGLLLVTNDGDLAYRLTRPAMEIPKVYRVKVTRQLNEPDAERFRDGIPLDGHRTRPAKLRPLTAASGIWYEVLLTEGRNRQVRRMFEALGNGVGRLSRTSIGPLRLGSLPAGKYRALTEKEVRELMVAVGMAEAGPKASRGRKPGWAKPKEQKRRPGKSVKREAGRARTPNSRRKTK